MTDPDYRAMCAELVEALHEHTCLYEGHESELVARARALLAEAVAERPTDEALWELYQGPGTFSPVEFARAVLTRWGRPAAAPVPEPWWLAELVADLNEIAQILCGMEKHRWAAKLTSAATLLQQQKSRIANLRSALRECGLAVGSLIQENCSDSFLLLVPGEVQLAVAAPAAAPVPVSERLQQLEDLVADAVSGLSYIEQTHGRLYGVGWDRVYEKADRLQPANALPLPAPEGGEVQ